MTALNWIGTAASLFGSKDNKFAKYFKGTYGVTIGNAVSGNFGTTLQSYYGPYITHCVDSGGLGFNMILGKYLNPQEAFGSSILGGIGGYVTWVYGPNITCNYGGPVGNITRGPTVSKTGQTTDSGGKCLKDPIPVPLSLSQVYDFKPDGDPPQGAAADATAAADKATLTAVNLLSLLLNLTIATLEIASKFVYSSFDPNTGAISMPDPSSNNYPMGGIDFTLTLLPPRLMGMIYTIEAAGSLEAWGQAWVKGAKDFFKDIADAAVTVANIPSYLEGKLEKAGMSTADAISTLVAVVLFLAEVAGIAALAATSGS